MTVTRLRNEMSWNELQQWMQFFDIHPHEYHTSHRAEFMAAQTAAMIVNTNRSEPVLPDDLMIQVREAEEPDYNDLKVFFIANGIEGKTGVKR